MQVRFQFHPVDESHNFEIYDYQSDHFYLYLIEASDYENDRDMLFEQFQYQLSVLVVGVQDWQEAERLRSDFAATAFDKVREVGHYSLLMVSNMQRKLAEFEIAPSECQRSGTEQPTV